MKAVVVMARGGDTPPGRVLASSCFSDYPPQGCPLHEPRLSVHIVDELLEEGRLWLRAPTDRRAQPHRKPGTGVPGAALYGSDGRSRSLGRLLARDSHLESRTKVPKKKFTSRWRLVVRVVDLAAASQYPLLTMGLPFARD